MLSYEAWAIIQRDVSLLSPMRYFTSTEIGQTHTKQDTGCLLAIVDSQQVLGGSQIHVQHDKEATKCK